MARELRLFLELLFGMMNAVRRAGFGWPMNVSRIVPSAALGHRVIAGSVQNDIKLGVNDSELYEFCVSGYLRSGSSRPYSMM